MTKFLEETDIIDYENVQNTLYLLKLIIQSGNDPDNGDVISQDEIFENLEKNCLINVPERRDYVSTVN